MSLKERVYSALLVSASDSFNDAVKSLLPESTYDPLRTVSSISAGKRACAERSFDFIIINAPLPDDMGMRFAIDQSNSASSAVLFIVRGELYDELYDKLAEHGVFLLAKPTPRLMMTTALAFLTSARERLRKTEKKTLSLEEKMGEIRIVNEAKWLLIDREGMTEEEAHRYLERSAMDRCVTKRAVAEEVIGKYPKQS